MSELSFVVEFEVGRERFRNLAASLPYVSLFASPWWLDCIAGPTGWSAIICEKSGRIVAGMPYVISNRTITQPQLTQHLGTWISYPDNQKYANRLGFEKDVLTTIAEGIAHLGQKRYFQAFHHAATNWLPFYWLGYEATLRYTYRIPDITDLGRVERSFLPKARTDIEKAKRTLTVTEEFASNTLYELNRLTFERQKLRLGYPKELVDSVVRRVVEMNKGKVLVARDGLGRPHAAVLVVWDSESAYYLMSGSDPALRSSGALSLLIWEAIVVASKVVEVFDFEGSMLEPVERFVRGFGAEQTPYLQVQKSFGLDVGFHLRRFASHARSVLKARGLIK